MFVSNLSYLLYLEKHWFPSQQLHLTKRDLILVLGECGPLANGHSLTWGFLIHSLEGTVVSHSPNPTDPTSRRKNANITTGSWKSKTAHSSPLVFSSSGGMAPECRMFFKQLSSLVADHRKETYSLVASWIKTKLSFSLLRSAILCIRGTRNPYYKSMTTDTNDINFEVQSTSINDDWEILYIFHLL